MTYYCPSCTGGNISRRRHAATAAWLAAVGRRAIDQAQRGAQRHAVGVGEGGRPHEGRGRLAIREPKLRNLGDPRRTEPSSSTSTSSKARHTHSRDLQRGVKRSIGREVSGGKKGLDNLVRGRLIRPANPRAGAATSGEMSARGCTWWCAGRVASLRCAPPRRRRLAAVVGVASAAVTAAASASASAAASASREVAAAAGASPTDRRCWAAAARRMACRHGGAERRRTPSARCWRGWSHRPRRWSYACRAAARAGTAGGAGRRRRQPIYRSTERCAVESCGEHV